MELKIKINYNISKKLSKDVVLNVSSEEITNYINEFPPHDLIGLEELLQDFIHDYDFDYDQLDLDIKDVSNWEIDENYLLNTHELASYFLHLILPERCCDNAPYNATYCPTCGKKLK